MIFRKVTEWAAIAINIFWVFIFFFFFFVVFVFSFGFLGFFCLRLLQALIKFQFWKSWFSYFFQYYYFFNGETDFPRPNFVILAEIQSFFFKVL
jgi:hypothetical protein